MIQRIKTDETGQVLVFALAFIAFMGVVGVVLLNYTTTNLRATSALRPVRSTNFAADGAVEGAINKLRHDPVATACEANFYRTVPALNGQEITLDCRNKVSAGTPAAPIVTATFVAMCPTSPVTPDCGTPGREILTATVRFEGAVPFVNTFVESWSVK